MTWNLIRLLLVPGWMAALWGSLQLHTLDLHLGHSICGPWGCGPPMEALLGYHGFWLMLILPLSACLGAYLPPHLAKILGMVVAAAGALIVVGYVGWDMMGYVKGGAEGYFLQRGLFKLVTSVDFPMMQVTLAGTMLVYAFGKRAASATRPSEPVADEPT